jgi:hypothetical protein
MHIVLNQFIFVTMTFTNTTNAASIFSKGGVSNQVANNISNKDNGTLQLQSYADPNNALGHLTQDKFGFSYTQPSTLHQSDESSMDSGTRPSSNKDDTAYLEDTEDNTNDNHLDTPISKKTLFNKPFNVVAPIITPQTKGHTTAEDDPKNPSSILVKQHPNHNIKKIYSSPFLESDYKPRIQAINLAPELELLKPLIMSQHEVFMQAIIELGSTTLYLSDIIDKKKESVNQIKNNNKIPRSLRIKCGLTTSPSYANNDDFLRLKDKLQEAVTCFTKTGTDNMTEWAEINIQLLKRDRCSSILSKALVILDGLSSFFLEVTGTPHFPSLPTIKYINLFLWKVYLSNMYIEVDGLAEFFDLPLEFILILGAKLIMKTNSDSEANSMLMTMNLNDIDVGNSIHENFLSETLISFDQILKITTIETWLFQKERNKQTTAAQNLKAKMASIRTTQATETTAQAIARATESLDLMKSKDLSTNLRISNLEKQIRKQEQKINEKFKSSQKNKTEEEKTSMEATLRGQ